MPPFWLSDDIPRSDVARARGTLPPLPLASHTQGGVVRRLQTAPVPVRVRVRVRVLVVLVVVVVLVVAASIKRDRRRRDMLGLVGFSSSRRRGQKIFLMLLLHEAKVQVLPRQGRDRARGEVRDRAGGAGRVFFFSRRAYLKKFRPGGLVCLDVSGRRLTRPFIQAGQRGVPWGPGTLRGGWCAWM